MLHLLFGLAGTGKTSWVLGQLRQNADAGRRSLLVVPEQFSSSSEGMVYRALGDARSALVEVASFRSLAERILRRCGGGQRPVLDDAARAVYVRRALDAVGGQLRTYARQRRSAAFCSLCAQTLQELKIAGATPQRLGEIAAAENDGKLEEIALIFGAYEAALENTAMDPEDRLTAAARQADCGYLDERDCFIDGFDGFTAPEYALLAPLLRHCPRVTVALCCAGLAEPAGGPDLFTPVRRAARRLLSLAAKAGVAAAAPETLADTLRPQTPALRALALLAAGAGDDEAPPPGGLTLTRAADEWEEVRFAAAQMRALALKGVPYGKMALICRDASAYERVARRQLALYGIPHFVDVPATVEYTAPVAFVRAALGLLRQGLAGAPVLALLKTGLCGCGEAELAALENYVFTWQPKAAEWRAAFEKNPDGFAPTIGAAARQQLELAEGLRAAAVPKLEKFIAGAKGANAARLSRRLYLLMDAFGAAEHAAALADAFERAGEYQQADGVRRAWDLTMDLLDRMAALVGGDTLSAAEYDELFLLLVRSTDFGQVPQTLECVTFTTADRMRLAEPDHCFVVGLCEGEFPMQIGYSGLLNHLDRDRLVAGGIEMPGSFENRTLLEVMFFYRALTAPRQGLYLSWPARRAGEAKAATSALQPLRLALDPPPLNPPNETLAATPNAAYDLLGAEYRANSTLAATLYAALDEAGGQARRLALLDEVDNPPAFTVADREAIRAIVGGEMTLSATRVERYYECGFSYYAERILGARPRRRAEVSPMESGTFVHYILEQVLREAGDGFAQCGDDALAAMAARHAGDFIRAQLPDDTKRGAWRLGSVLQTTARLLAYMRSAAAASSFAIEAVELVIGDGPGEIPPLEVRTAAGERVRLTGAIDRVDTLRQNGQTYVSVVDYKTGSKKFSLDELYCGKNMQLMIYLDTLCKNGGARFENSRPAGVLYLMADPAPATGGRQGGEGEAFRYDGLLLAEAGVLRQMDNSGGAFLPVRFNKDGSPRAGAGLAGEGKFRAVMAHVEERLAAMAEGVYDGQFSALPLVKGNSRPCAWCPYRAACRHEDGRDEREVQAPQNAFDAADAQEEGV